VLLWVEIVQYVYIYAAFLLTHTPHNIQKLYIVNKKYNKCTTIVYYYSGIRSMVTVLPVDESTGA